MSSINVFEIPVFVDVHDVMGSMKCSRTMAYAHMRAALCRTPGARGQIRVPGYVWQRYVRAHFDPDGAAEAPRHERNRTNASVASPIAITRPRTKPRNARPHCVKPEDG